MPEAAQVNGWHALRHTAAPQWLSNGLSLARTAAYLGDTPLFLVNKPQIHFWT